MESEILAVLPPQLGVNDKTVMIEKWHISDGEYVTAGKLICTLETRKAVFDYESETSGYLVHLVEAGQEIKINQPIALIGGNLKALIKEKQKYGKPVRKKREEARATTVQTPAVINISDEALREALRPELGDMEDFDGLTFRQISQFKQMEIDSLTKVQSGHLGCCLSIHVNAGNLLKIAEGYFDIFRDALLPFIIFEAARLLKKYPELNAFFIDGRIAFYPCVNIGLAINLNNGLKILKLPGVDKMDLKEVEATVLKTVDKYLDRKIAQDDVTGITFTLTDLSKLGLCSFSPLIPQWQSAILGIGAIDEKLQRCVLMLTFDHRVTDGKLAGKFLQDLKNNLENYCAPQAPVEPPAPGCFKCQASLQEIRQLHGIGLFRVIDCSGKEQYICERCAQGRT